MADERKIREIYGVKSVHEEATERTEETWREATARDGRPQDRERAAQGPA